MVQDRPQLSCIQALNYPGVFKNLQAIVKEIHQLSKIAISISCQPLKKNDIQLLAEAGAERIGIPIDAATEDLFEQVKGRFAGGPYSWKKQFELLKHAVKIYGEDKVSTHLIVGLGETRETTVTGIEMFQKTLEEGLAGDNVGLLLRGIQKEDIERGMVLAAPATITPHTVFEAEVYILTKEEGGRHTPFFTGYRPQFYVRTTDVTGNIKQFTADDGTEVEMVMPGDRIKMTAELISAIAIEDGMRFAIREGGRTIGAGVVSKIVT